MGLDFQAPFSYNDLNKRGNEMPTCYMLIGCPGSGKSTFIQKNLLDFPYNEECEFPVPFVTGTDAIIERIAEAVEETYHNIFKDVYKFAEKLFWKDIVAAAEDRQDIVLDRTNMTKAGRSKFFRALDGYRFEAIVFPVPKDLDKRLASRIDKNIPKHVITGMINSFDMPSMEEGFDAIWSPEEFLNHIKYED